MREEKSAGGPREGYFTAGGLKLHFVEWGDATDEALVLVHGIRDQCRCWDYFVAALSARSARPYHMVALDLRGHGESDWSPPGRGYQHEDYLSDLAGLWRHLKKGSVTLIGHSLGGSMSLLFAGCFPDRVEKLVLVESTGPFGRAEEELPGLLAQWLERENDHSEKFFYPTLEAAAEALRGRFPLIPIEASHHWVRHGARPAEQGYLWKFDPRLRFPSRSTFSERQVRAFIERLRCPTLIIFGAESDLAKSGRGSRAGLFKSARVAEIRGSGHHVPHEKPDELAGVVAAFLREQPSPVP